VNLDDTFSREDEIAALAYKLPVEVCPLVSEGEWIEAFYVGRSATGLCVVQPRQLGDRNNKYYDKPIVVDSWRVRLKRDKQNHT